MKILNTQQIRQWDDYTIDNEPILGIDLMERAAQRLFAWLRKHYAREESFLIFAGPGNNGGDALALARMLYNAGYIKVRVAMLKIGSKLSDECFKNLNRLETMQKVEIIYCNEGDCEPAINEEDVVIDGIFGSGIKRPINGYWAKIVDHINENSFETIAIDFPSGLYGEDNMDNEGAKIEAQITLTFQFPNLAFFFADNLQYFGRWYVLDIGLHQGFMNEVDVRYFLTEKEDVRHLIKQRKTFGHKGTYGHGFLIAGSYRQTGAAVLAAQACLRSGIGLVTVHVPETGREIMQITVPEAMVCIDETEMLYCEDKALNKFSAVGIGPGIGKKQSMKNALKRLLENSAKPLVMDADALNILSENKEWYKLLPANTILTPHLKEFDRLTHEHPTSYERYKTQLKFSEKYNVIMVLKGGYTCITDPQGNSYFNSTGNPGMATAGSGDVLTGIILSLLSQGYNQLDAAKFGVFLHGYAGDLAADKLGYESLIASDIINYLGQAFNKVRKG